MLSIYAPAMPAQVDLVSVVLYLAAAGVNKAHERAAAAEWALVGEGALYAPGRFDYAHGERRTGQHLRHAICRSSFKNKGHEVVLFLVQQIGNVFALRRRDREAARDLLGHPDNGIKLTVQLRGHADRQRLRPGSEDGERKRPLPGQLVAEGCGEYAREAALPHPGTVINFNHVVSLLKPFQDCAHRPHSGSTGSPPESGPALCRRW